MKKAEQRQIQVYAHWHPLPNPAFVGTLYATPSRGKEMFSFEYDSSWLGSREVQSLDPSLGLYKGPQYAPDGHNNFGVFLDSSPDRWGRVLMLRREAQAAREENRTARKLLESDYLMGVFDAHRMGALRFRIDPQGPFLDDNHALASPPFTSLRELEHASLQLEQKDAEKDPEYAKWLRLLLAPGASLGGARPKADVVDKAGLLWIAKFPSRSDDLDVGAWEDVVHRLATRAGIVTSPAYSRQFTSRHRTFLTQRFDRTRAGERIHFASAMTLLKRTDGDDYSKGASYIDLAQFIVQAGAQPIRDLQQLWRRIVFSICVSNVDDHLRNHGFFLTPAGWELSPAYDMNPVETGDGLKLNISTSDNSQDLDLVREVAPQFRMQNKEAKDVIDLVTGIVRTWRTEADTLAISPSEQERMSRAFRVADAR